MTNLFRKIFFCFFIFICSSCSNEKIGETENTSGKLIEAGADFKVYSMWKIILECDVKGESFGKEFTELVSVIIEEEDTLFNDGEKWKEITFRAIGNEIKVSSNSNKDDSPEEQPFKITENDFEVSKSFSDMSQKVQINRNTGIFIYSLHKNKGYRELIKANGKCRKIRKNKF